MHDPAGMTSQQITQLLDKAEDAAEKDRVAHLAAKDALIAVLRAQLAERDAELDLVHLQWGGSLQTLDCAISIAQDAAKSARSAV